MSKAEGHWVLERTTWSGAAEHILFLKQKKAYEFAAEQVKGKHVLDYGIGSGFGTVLLAEDAEHITGVDIFKKTIAFCKKNHRKENVKFVQIGSSYTTPFPDDHFDMITSFQVIEHVDNVEAYLLEFKRILKPGGTLLITTPNRSYRLLPFQKPWNEEHLREYSKRGLYKDIVNVFDKVQIISVSGNDAVTQIEHARVKQSPLHVYLLGPMKRVAKWFLPARMIEKYKKGEVQPSKEEKKYTAQFSTDDFIVGNNDKQALDWVAIVTM